MGPLLDSHVHWRLSCSRQLLRVDFVYIFSTLSILFPPNPVASQNVSPSDHRTGSRISISPARVLSRALCMRALNSSAKALGRWKVNTSLHYESYPCIHRPYRMLQTYCVKTHRAMNLHFLRFPYCKSTFVDKSSAVYSCTLPTIQTKPASVLE